MYELPGAPLSKTALCTDFPLDTEEVLDFEASVCLSCTMLCEPVENQWSGSLLRRRLWDTRCEL